jgi:hypothetical protein
VQRAEVEFLPCGDGHPENKAGHPQLEQQRVAEDGTALHGGNESGETIGEVAEGESPPL